MHGRLVAVGAGLTLGILGLDALHVRDEPGQAVAHEGGADRGLHEVAVLAGQHGLGAQTHGLAGVYEGDALLVEGDGEAGGVRARDRTEVDLVADRQLVVLGVHDHARTNTLDGLAAVAIEVGFLMSHEQDDVVDDGDETPGAGVANEWVLSCHV